MFQKQGLDIAYAAVEADLSVMEARDRAFVRLLVTLCLKRARQIDDVLAGLLHEPLDNLRPQQMINIFRIGIVQLAFLGTPAHAAVSTTVELAEDAGVQHHKSLVNAVMRRLAATGFPEMEDRDAGRANTPEWLWNAWMQDYGVETALEIAAAHLHEAPVDFTVTGDAVGWAEKLEGRVLPTGFSVRRDTAGYVPDLPGYDDGAWWVQNVSAALPAALLGDVTGKCVVDLCAAPGGKTAQLARAGANVIALDRSAPRMKRLEENMARLQCNVETVIADGAIWKPPELVDAVLLDAPCTATGTIRHQPDVLHLKTIKDQEKMCALQRRLMVAALDMLKPGGILVCCTCSLQKAEGEEQAAWLLEQGLPVSLMPIAVTEVPGISDMLTNNGDIRCLPQYWGDKGGMDGFYVVRFVKEA